MLQEAKQNARSNDLVLKSERAPNSKPNRCAVKRRLRESGAELAKQGGREVGGGEKIILTLKISANDPLYILLIVLKSKEQFKKK